MDILKAMILGKNPDYDENRYHFKFKDIIKLNLENVMVLDSYISEVRVIYLTGANKGNIVKVNYSDLPYYTFCGFVTEDSVAVDAWEVGSVVIDHNNGFKLILLEDQKDGYFRARVLDSNGTDYTNTYDIVCKKS